MMNIRSFYVRNEIYILKDVVISLVFSFLIILKKFACLKPHLLRCGGKLFFDFENKGRHYFVFPTLGYLAYTEKPFAVVLDDNPNLLENTVLAIINEKAELKKEIESGEIKQFLVSSGLVRKCMEAIKHKDTAQVIKTLGIIEKIAKK